MIQEPLHMHSDGPSTIKISIDKLESEFQCTICLNPISDAYITRCGHVYCKGCIEQTINRHHRCPFCTQELKDFKADVFKNYHFNTIRKIVEDEKKYETKKYMQKVFASDKKNILEVQDAQIQALLKPVEKKIVQYCQKALLEYRKFLVGMFELEKQAEQKKALHGSLKIRDHQTIITQITTFIMDNFPSPIISPQILSKPTTIQLTLPGNKPHKNTINLAPMSTFQLLLPYIQKICSQNNLALRGKIQQKLVINGSQCALSDRVGVLCGGVIAVEKGIPFEEKVYCFTYNWDKEKTSNFFTCKSCNVKWICQNCALYCHGAHQCQLQINKHKADWAMCYCVTKCECKAYNKNNRMEE